jgi:hypothetical protein
MENHYNKPISTLNTTLNTTIQKEQCNIIIDKNNNQKHKPKRYSFPPTPIFSYRRV